MNKNTKQTLRTLISCLNILCVYFNANIYMQQIMNMIKINKKKRIDAFYILFIYIAFT